MQELLKVTPSTGKTEDDQKKMREERLMASSQWPHTLQRLSCTTQERRQHGMSLSLTFSSSCLKRFTKKLKAR